MINVDFIRLEPAARAPRRAYDDDAGWDLFVLEDTYLPIGMFAYVRTGIAVALPDGYYGRVVRRSSSIAKRGLVVVEGTMDAGYRGEQLIGVWNPGIRRRHDFPFGTRYAAMDAQLDAGDSIAQLIVQPVIDVAMREVEQLPPSVRGVNGFGSTGS